MSLALRTRDRVVILMRDNDTWNESPVIEFPDTEELEHIGQQARPPLPRLFLRLLTNRNQSHYTLFPNTER